MGFGEEDHRSKEVNWLKFFKEDGLVCLSWLDSDFFDSSDLSSLSNTI